MKIICPAATIIARQLSQTKPLGFTYSFIIECSRGATLLVSNQKGWIDHKAASRKPQKWTSDEDIKSRDFIISTAIYRQSNHRIVSL